MKKFLFILTALFAMMSVNAQDENNTLVSLLKLNFEGVTPKYMPTGDNPMTVEGTADGLALTHGNTAGSPKDFQIQISDECLTFQKKHNYFVRLTAKIPHKGYGKDGGYIAVQLGNEKFKFQSGAIVYGDDDFQVIEIEVPKYPDDIEGDGYIVIDAQYVLGTSVIKDIEIFEVVTPEPPIIDGLKQIVEKSWEGIEVYGPLWDGEKPDWNYEGTDEGLAFTNPTLKSENWAAQVAVAYEFDLEQNHNYIVRLTMKVPSDGTFLVNLGSWSSNSQYEVTLPANDDFLVVDVQFPDLCGDIGYEIDGLIENAHVILGCGFVVGTTVIKKVEVYEVMGSSARGGTTAIDSVKAVKSDGQIYNLAGQKVDASYKGIVIQNSKKRIAR